MQIFILQTVGGFTASGDTGGSVVQLLSLAREWSASGHDVHLITNASDQGGQRYAGGYPVHWIPSLGLFREPSPFHFFIEALLNPLVQWRALGSLMRETLRPPAVVVTPSPYPSDAFMAFWVSRRFGVPAVVSFYHLHPPPWWFPRRRGNPLRLVGNWLLWQFALVLVKLGGLLPLLNQSRGVRLAWKFPRIMPAACFLDSRVDVPPGVVRLPYTACFVGRIAPNKGIIDLLKIWSRVIRQVPEAKLIVAGRCYDWRFDARIDRTIARLGLRGKVERRGFISDWEKGGLLAEAQIFLFPSYEEGWSLSVMEAASLGAVPVVYDLPAYGYLDCDEIKVPVGEVSAMADLVTALLRDPKRLASLADRLRNILTGYTREAIAERQARFLEEYAVARGRHKGNGC